MTEEEFERLVANSVDQGRVAFLIFKDEDGNYRGAKKENKQVVFVRDVGPETVLQLLLTHDGKQTN